jgi:hypothetical protein
MHPLVIAGIGLADRPDLTHAVSKVIAWGVIIGAGALLLRSSLIPLGIRLAVSTLAFFFGVGWADHVGVLQAVTGHNVDDADKLLVALGATFVLWMAFLREDRPRRSHRTLDELPDRVLTRGRR